MEDRMLWLRDQNSNLIAKVTMTKNCVYLLNLKNGNAMCLKTYASDPSWIWHIRFNHLNFGRFNALGEKKIMKGIATINHHDQLCEACLLGKHPRKSFPKQSFLRATKPFELVHAMFVVLLSFNVLVIALTLCFLLMTIE